MSDAKKIENETAVAPAETPKDVSKAAAPKLVVVKSSLKAGAIVNRFSN